MYIMMNIMELRSYHRVPRRSGVKTEILRQKVEMDLDE